MLRLLKVEGKQSVPKLVAVVEKLKGVEHARFDVFHSELSPGWRERWHALRLVPESAISYVEGVFVQ